jgi:hypothetical protein
MGLSGFGGEEESLLLLLLFCIVLLWVLEMCTLCMFDESKVYF